MSKYKVGSVEDGRGVEIEVRRYIIRNGVRVEITGCFWCGNADYVCSACTSAADKASKSREEK